MRKNHAGDFAWNRSMAVAAFAAWMGVVGCQTTPPSAPQSEPPRGYLNTLPGNAESPGTSSSSVNPQLPLPAPVREVVAVHGVPPPRVLEGSAGSLWAVSAKPRSDAEVSLLLIQMSSKQEVTVEMTGCARVGRGWPVLGERFQEPMKKEAKQMEKEIQERLRGAPP